MYDAIRRFDDSVVVSNGNQTDTFGRYLRCGKSFEDAAITLLYEPDSPNYTPRISGFVEIGQKVAGISIVKKVGDEAIHKTWRYDTLDGNELPLHDGIGRAIHTYQGEDSGILSPYNEDPFVLPLMGNAEDMANLLWNSLNPDTRVAVAVMAFSLTNQDVQIHTINKHTQVNV
ncbi:hypothetical protein IPL68_05815 [Candidatus Saccharibacteria bacterium]|nr:MAG: hypothetical protein IPL68_05815 [Candidatus Saccharibacteria bacterium]